MDTVIAFPLERTKKDAGPDRRPGQIVIFPGVRIERFPAKPVKIAPVKRRPRGTTTAGPAGTTSESA